MDKAGLVDPIGLLDVMALGTFLARVRRIDVHERDAGAVGTLIKVALVFVCAIAVYFTTRHTHRRQVRAAPAEEGEALRMRRSAATALATRRGRRRELGHVATPERAAVRERQKQMVGAAEDRAATPRPS